MDKLVYIMLILALVFLLALFGIVLNKKTGFLVYWKAILKSSSGIGVIFFIIEMIFLRANVWRFNDDFISGFNIADIPVERLITIFFIPLFSILAHEFLAYVLPKFKQSFIILWISILIGLASLYFAISNPDRLYTFVFMILSGTTIFWQIFYGNHKTWLTRFYLMFLLCVNPFAGFYFLLASIPIVYVNQAEILNIRLYGIPIEDFLYLLTMNLMVIMLYEQLKHLTK